MPAGPAGAASSAGCRPSPHCNDSVARRPPELCEALPGPGLLAAVSSQMPPTEEICQGQLIPCGLSVSLGLFCLRPGVGGESGPDSRPLTRARDSSVPGPLCPDPGSGSSAMKRPVSRRRAAR